MNGSLSRSRISASSGLFDGRSLAVTAAGRCPPGTAVVSQANVFSVIGAVAQLDPVGPAFLADVQGVAQVVAVRVGHVPAQGQLGLPGRAVGVARRRARRAW